MNGTNASRQSLGESSTSIAKFNSHKEKTGRVVSRKTSTNSKFLNIDENFDEDKLLSNAEKEIINQSRNIKNNLEDDFTTPINDGS
jgi:hypothetical protein